MENQTASKGDACGVQTLVQPFSPSHRNILLWDPRMEIQALLQKFARFLKPMYFAARPRDRRQELDTPFNGMIRAIWVSK